jgi:hypothetical protein
VKGGAALGSALVLVHALGFVALSGRAPAPFEVRVDSAPASATLTLTGSVAGELRERVRRDLDELAPDSPGLRRIRWRAEYRGGFVRSVAAVQLVGGFQDPAALPCSGRISVSQQLLDDGATGTGTIAYLVRGLLEQQLARQGRFPIGEFRGVTRLSLRWAEVAAHPQDAAMMAAIGAQHGYLRVDAVIAFDRVEIPVVVGLVPQLDDGAIAVRVAARASLAFGNQVAQWFSDHFGGDRLASALLRRQLSDVLTSALLPPAPLPLPGGGALRFVLCGRNPEIVEGSYGALAFAVAIEALPGYPQHLPPLLLAGPMPAPPATAHVALDLDLNALNAMLYGAWRDGFLDRQLGAAEIAQRFNRDPLVATYLSVRISAPRLTLPPVVTSSPSGLRLAAETALTIQDGTTETLGRVWSTMMLSTGPVATHAKLSATVEDLDLTCEPRPQLLTPCYADLIAALHARTSEFNGALTSVLSQLIDHLFHGRHIGAPELPAELAIISTTPSLLPSARSATLRLALAVELVTVRP